MAFWLLNHSPASDHDLRPNVAFEMQADFWNANLRSSPLILISEN